MPVFCLGKGVNNVGDPSLQRPILVRTNMQENPYACIKRNKEWNNKNFLFTILITNVHMSICLFVKITNKFEIEESINPQRCCIGRNCCYFLS